MSLPKPIRAAALPLCALTLLTTPAAADPVTLRMAAIAPDGTEWARTLKAFARDVEVSSKGELKMKWYLGGIAGDELAALERVKQGQLDGEAGSSFCARLAPSLRAARLGGLYESRDEVVYIMGRLKPVLDEEFRKSGFFNLGQAVFGADVLFSRQPIRTFDELRAAKLWAWNLDPVWQQIAQEMGLKTMSTSIDEHSPAWRRKSYDAFFTVPSVALAYQWSAEVPYYTDFAATMLPACLVVANAALDPLPLELKQVLQSSAAKFMIHFNEISVQLDDALTSGLFEKQGLKRVPASPALRREFYAAARRARDKLGAALIAPALLSSVEKMLAEHRQQRREGAKR
ncbi:MAG: TRAP-type C4-dicarboxylate transport system, substrate-binding protein [Myxococcales bacterium]|nr:TRAP-type C4-dicarboxylate transport system, substrate-binding protein [Myxococcales bacterium]